MSIPTRLPRQGLPRIPGGEPWPPAEFLATVPEALPADPVRDDAVQPTAAAPVAESPAVESPVAENPMVEAPAPPMQPVSPAAPPALVAPATAVAGVLRRGLPRVPGGESWPPADTSVASASTVEATEAVARPQEAAPAIEPAVAVPVETAESAPPAPAIQASTGPAAGSAPAPVGNLRRGLPRTPGGQPWPPASAVPAAAAASGSVSKSSAPAQPAAPAVQGPVAPAACWSNLLLRANGTCGETRNA